MRIFTPLSDVEFDAVSALAQRERRDVRDQLALLIRYELQRMNLLSADAPEVHTSSVTKAKAQPLEAIT